MNNIGEAFSYPLKDRDWPAKLLIGALFTLGCILLLGIPVVKGYNIMIVQRVRRGEQPAMPEWKDVGIMFILGLKYIVVLFIYSLPMLLVAIPMFMFIILNAVTHGSAHAASVMSMGMMTIVYLVIVPYSLALTLFTPAITILFAENERIGNALQIGKVVQLFRRHWQDCLVTALLGIAVELVAGLGIILFIIGVLATIFYASLVKFHLFGQLAHVIDSSSTTSQPV